MNVMNIYLITNNDMLACNGLAGFENDAVRWLVFARDKKQAMCIGPDGDDSVSMYQDITVTLLGTSFEATEPKLILTSFT